MKQVKLAVLGGGSSYLPELLDGVVRKWEQGEFHAESIALVDVPDGKNRMETVADFSRRMMAKRGMPCHLETFLNRREALDGTSFVVSQIRVGGMKARWNDERIPLRYSVIGQETTGAGGFANALRTIPASLDIARDVLNVCPEAWLLNFSNPSGLVTEALATEALVNHTGLKTFGLCNVPIGIKMGVAKALSADPSRVSMDVSGLNHLSFVTGLYLDGEDVFDQVFDSPLMGAFLEAMKFAPEFGRYLRRLRVIPASYLYYYWFTERALKGQQENIDNGTGTRADEVMRIEEVLFQEYEKPDSADLPPDLKKRGGAYYSDVALSAVSGILRNSPVDEVLNVKNGGAVPGLEPDAIVEVSCMVDGRGPRPLCQKPLPTEVLGLVQQVKAYEKLTVKAAVDGDVETAFFALLNHPLVPGADAALAILGDILETNRDYLPQFKGKKV